MIYYTGMSSDEEDIPDLVPATSKVPITIITGFLGRCAICVWGGGGQKFPNQFTKFNFILPKVNTDYIRQK